jgi:tRNA(adenine34) deaminase
MSYKTNNEQLQVYHIYPLGFFNAYDNREGVDEKYLLKLIDFIPHLKEMHINMVYIGPLFSSEYHGYDTIDYYQVDKRLGSNEDLIKLVDAYHDNGIKVILDTVFNHVSRSFFAFKDLLVKQQNSMYVDWFSNVDFNQSNVDLDPFSYDNWDGHNNLVKLNLYNEWVEKYLFDVVDFWINTFHIDGLRLDAADVMASEFLNKLSDYCKSLSSEFFIMGEIVHGDYNRLLQKGGLDSVTNYEGYKGLYSSLNDQNYFEIDYALKREFGENGIYKNHLLYNFVDNHDVNRVASLLKDEGYLYPLYLMLYTMPGIPSLYYGSEFGAKGLRTNTSDQGIRKPWEVIIKEKNIDLFEAIKRFSEIRLNYSPLHRGSYQPLYVNHKQIAYVREWHHERFICIINADGHSVNIDLELKGTCYDVLNHEQLILDHGICVYPYWGRILKL